MNVSVLMTVYNGETYVKEAVESVLAQTYADFELIIVDNASVDGTVRVLNSIHDPRIRLILNDKNLGQTKALNIAIASSKGEFLARMDADDVSLPQRLEKQVAFLSAHPRAGVVGGWQQEIDPYGRPLKIMTYPTDPTVIRSHMLSDGNLTLRCFSHPSAFFRKAALSECGGYNEEVKFAQDYDLWVRMLPKWEIHNLPEVLIRYRVSSASTSSRNMDEMLGELDRIVSRNIQSLWPGIPEENRKSLVRMLRNKPPASAAEGNRLYELFDALFEKAFPDHRPLNGLRKTRDEIKFLYAPQLSRVAPGKAFVFMAAAVLRQPNLLVRRKFYKNILKIIMPSKNPQSNFHAGS